MPGCSARSSASIWAGRSRAGRTRASSASLARSPATCTNGWAARWWCPMTTSPAPSSSSARCRDAGADRAITPAAIGRAWLNYLIEEAAAFVEADIDRLLDTAVALIPNDSLIARLIGDVRDWHAAAGGAQWRQTFARIRGRYGYDRYGGNCHVVPNHALIIMALLGRRRRLRPFADHRQHRGLGHRLQLRQRRLPARHPRRPGGGRRTLARAGRRPPLPAERRRRRGGHRRHPRRRPAGRPWPSAGWRRAACRARPQGRRPVPLRVPRLGAGVSRRQRRAGDGGERRRPQRDRLPRPGGALPCPRHRPPHGRHYPDRLPERSPPRRRLRPARLTDPASRSTAAPRGGRRCRQPRRDHPHPGAGGSHGGRHRTPGRRRAVPGPRGRRGYGVDGAGDRRQSRRRGGRAHRRTGGGRHRLPRLPGLARRTPRTLGPAGQATARRRSWTRRRSAPLPTCRNASPSPQTARPLPAALATGLRCPRPTRPSTAAPWLYSARKAVSK